MFGKIGNGQKLPSFLTDPFKRDSVTGIWLQYRKPICEDKYIWEGHVEFTKNNCEGRYNSKKYEEFMALLREIDGMLNTLK